MITKQLSNAMTSEPQLEITQAKANRWGIVLAGGDGVRLRRLTRFICGDDRPKQFCRVLGRQTLLEQTRYRAERSIPAEKTIYALTAAHESYYEQDLVASPSQRLVQPQNRGTAPPIILSLFHIVAQQPEAMVAILPCDHYYSDESVFTTSLEAAFETGRNQRDSVILLGAQSTGPEVEFGWIELGASAGENVYQVRGFVEKPKLKVAQQLFQTGALWNTFVMVGHAITFLWMAFGSVRDLAADLEFESALLIKSGDSSVRLSTYQAIPTVDFSRQVLSPNAHRLLARPLTGLEWHDLGHADRVVSVVRSRHVKVPRWIQAWEAASQSAQAAMP